MSDPEAPPGVAFLDLKPAAAGFLDDVLAGLSAPVPAIPPKYFYDAQGSALFEAICATPEYYVTRTEIALLEARAGEIAAFLGPRCRLVEYGCGSAVKTRILLRALDAALFQVVDIARGQLLAAAADIAAEFPGLPIMAVCGDYTRPLALPAPTGLAWAKSAVFFPGSSVGNFTPAETRVFLREVARSLGPGGALVIGVDLRKDKARLDAAYNDAAGVTARFNLNLLARMNRELGADVDLSAFRHLAFYDEARGRVEMHLEALRDTAFSVAGRRFAFRAGQRIHTENSCKYGVGEFRDLAADCGFRPVDSLSDPEGLFAIHLLTVDGALASQ